MCDRLGAWREAWHVFIIDFFKVGLFVDSYSSGSFNLLWHWVINKSLVYQTSWTHCVQTRPFSLAINTVKINKISLWTEERKSPQLARDTLDWSQERAAEQLWECPVYWNAISWDQSVHQLIWANKLLEIMRHFGCFFFFFRLFFGKWFRRCQDIPTSAQTLVSSITTDQVS